MLPDYAELHCLSNFTFLRGASHPEELVERAHALGYSALALTDECSVAGAVRAHVAAARCGLKLIIGAEITLVDGLKLVLLAASREGYGRLCALITRGRTRAAKGAYRIERGDLEEGLPGCIAILIPPVSPAANPPFSHAGEGSGVREGWHDALEQARFVGSCLPGNAWIAAELLCGPNDRARLAGLTALTAASGLPLAAAGDVHMHVRSRRRLQDVLTSIRLGLPVSEAGDALHPNAERHLRHRFALARIHPPGLLAQAVEIARRCDFSLDTLRYEYPAETVPAGETPANHLRRLTQEGSHRRFPEGVPPRVASLVEHELALIAELRYEHFFLTVHDIVRFARSRDILCQGRGSAANSAVCYCLGITEVDPSRMSVLFERFISRERNEPPDIDVDFEHERREEVIQYIYGKYGRERAALAATVITYRPKSALRDAGKALGLAPAQLDRLAGSLAWWDRRELLRARFLEAGLDPGSREIRLLVGIVSVLVGFPRHLSQHTGGFVISGGPLAELVPVENAAMPGRSVIQWDKDDLDQLGLLKVDVLALGMLTAIRRALALAGRRRGSALTMQAILDRGDDAAVYDAICRADTIGVFQIESRAQISMLPRLKPRTFYDLVIEIAIVRPGPIQGGMVHPYLRRRQGLEPVTYPSGAVEQVLSRTLGVPIFQEQVMQLAIVAAGFSPGEADRLRRSMAAWRRKGGLEQFHPRLVSGMKARGYSSEFAEQIYRQICGFGEYGFPESHSASFALLAYVSAWLKHHEPAAFLAALLNSQPMGFYAPSQLVQDARRHGVAVLPVDVTSSDWECTLEHGNDRSSPITHHPSRPCQPAVRLGLLMVKGFSRASAERLLAARAQAAFANVDDLSLCAELNRHELRLLADAGALAALAGHRRLAHWQAAGTGLRPPLLREAPIVEAQPSLAAPGEGEDLVADYRSLGLTLGRHPLALLRRRLSRMRLVTAADLAALPDGGPCRTAGIVTCRQCPGTANGVVFVTLEDETGCVNVIVWRRLVKRQRRELLGASLLGVAGVVQREGDVLHVVAHRLADHSRLLGRLTTASRDFH